MVSSRRLTPALYRTYRGDRPAVAVIYAHSHVNHFGGVQGVASPEDVSSGKVQIIAPAGFHGTRGCGEYLAGTRMIRRAAYMYGAQLSRSPRGSVGAGLGRTTSTGEVGILPPTVDVHETGESLTVDGIKIEFQTTPNTETPAEMHFYFPRFRALRVAENATHTLHNILTLHSAVVRDSRAWASSQ